MCTHSNTSGLFHEKALYISNTNFNWFDRVCVKLKFNLDLDLDLNECYDTDKDPQYNQRVGL